MLRTIVCKRTFDNILFYSVPCQYHDVAFKCSKVFPSEKLMTPEEARDLWALDKGLATLKPLETPVVLSGSYHLIYCGILDV